MRALAALTVANIKSFTRDRAALFWTLAFPLLFILLFGFIFEGGGDGEGLRAGWVDEDGSTASSELAPPSRPRKRRSSSTSIASRRSSRCARVSSRPCSSCRPDTAMPSRLRLTAPAPPRRSSCTRIRRARTSRPASSSRSARVLGVVNLGGRPPLVVPEPEVLQTENLNFISYFVPSVLALSVMQVGIFAAIPLVADREKLILKRLAATPLRRWQLVGSNIAMRLLIALAQAVIIIGVGMALFGVEVTGPWGLSILFISLGAVTFLALGYVIASFAKTEDSANGMTSVVQFPMMFLSGVFFPIDQMPDVIQTIARIIPLTYLADALRQIMVGGAAFAPLTVCFGVLAAWLVVCFAIAARKFQWQ